MKANIRTRLYIGFAAAIFLVIVVGIISYLAFSRQNVQEGWVKHTYKVNQQLSELQTLLINMETGRRGFRSTNERKFLEPYFFSINKIDPAIAGVRALVNNNPHQLTNLAKTELSIRDLLFFWRGLGDRSALYTREQIIIINEQEKKKMDLVKSNLAQMTMVEQGLLTQRENTNLRSIQLAKIWLISSIFLILIIVLVLNRFILKEFNARTIVEAKLATNNADLLAANRASEEKNWALTGIASLNEHMQGDHSTKDVSAKILYAVAKHVGVNAAAIYLLNKEENSLVLTDSIGLSAQAKRGYEMGEGFVGSVGRNAEVLLVDNLGDDAIMINGGTINVKTAQALYVPFCLNNQLKGVIELFSFQAFAPRQIEFLSLAENNISIAVHSAQSREEVSNLLEQVQQQKEEMENQQEELRQANEELNMQTEVLQASEEEMKVQEEELRQINVELKEKNKSIEKTRQSLVNKARELQTSSNYKSEFLANMSHELRTPLNSVLILAKLLADNINSNLTPKQVEHAGIIYKSGGDLLKLINDILDLSKIEAGKADLQIQSFAIKSVAFDIEQMFSVVADEKAIVFKVDTNALQEESMTSDRQKLEQIIKNLVSNALKFTEVNGEVRIVFESAQGQLKVQVEDTGIGINSEKQQLIFEAFQQGDGATTRKYGGTGLGLSITKELVKLLGGSISVSSQEAEGSVFSVVFPLHLNESPTRQVAKFELSTETTVTVPETIVQQNLVADDRSNILSTDKVILIIEDDDSFAFILKEIAKEKGYKTIVALSGDEGLFYANKYVPHAIILDMKLPIIEGKDILQALKANSQLRHVPVHIVSAFDEILEETSSAVSFLRKPVAKKDIDAAFDLIHQHGQAKLKQVLLLSGQHLQDGLMYQLFSDRHLEINCEVANDFPQAISILNNANIDCIVADIGNDLSATDSDVQSLHDLARARSIPLIIYLDKDLSVQDEMRLKQVSEAIVRTSQTSQNRLMDELELFLYKVHEETTRGATLNLAKRVGQNGELKEKNILLVDDDMRNVFAVKAALESYEMNIITASDGHEALSVLKENNRVDLVLMDIMMPEMDGYEAITHIRKTLKKTQLPVIALTAKAMRGDREKCLQAGASDYITKPVDIQKLVSLMRVWLS